MDINKTIPEELQKLYENLLPDLENKFNTVPCSLRSKDKRDSFKKQFLSLDEAGQLVILMGLQ